MRRTHILHSRDNRRSFPSHHAPQGRDDRDQRTLAWRLSPEGDRDTMLLDGEPVAHVEPFGEPRYDLLGELVQPTRAFIGNHPPVDFNTHDAARLHCERHFARAA